MAKQRLIEHRIELLERSKTHYLEGKSARSASKLINAKLRITGRPDEVKDFVRELPTHFHVLQVSQPYKNRNSQYVRVYAEVTKKS
ncbi:DUF3970 family protein [Laceyella tengchongensis]|nr:DUF3970 family protein [Laceyella tengchongensis]